MTDKYILDDNGIAVEEPDLMAWGKWMSTAARLLAHADIDGVRISTVFLGLDHNYGDGAPILFETMIFGGEHDQYQERYATRTEAMIGHMAAFRMVQRRKF